MWSKFFVDIFNENSILQFIMRRSGVCFLNGVLTVYWSEAGGRPVTCCSVFKVKVTAPTSKRYRRAITSFSARRFDVSHRRGCWDAVSKSFNFWPRVRFPKKMLERELRPFRTSWLSYASIALVSVEEKRAQISVGKWNIKSNQIKSNLLAAKQGAK